MKHLLAAVFVCSLFLGLSAAHAQDFAANRLDFSLGVFMPSGDYSEPRYESLPYDNGAAFGLGFTHYINENIGFGAFLDGNYLGTGEQYAGTWNGNNIYGEMNIASVIIGGHMQLQIPVSLDISLFGAAKLGGSSNSINFKAQTRSKSYSHTNIGEEKSVALIVEGGLRYAIGYNFDIAALLKYTANKQTFAGEGFDSELGGLTLAVGVGLRFN